MHSLKALSMLLLVGVVAAQYNYKKPEAPKNTYLPPKPESDTNIGADAIAPEAAHEPGMPYDFTYAVKEDDGIDHSHNAQSDGDVVKGEYRTLLPDGRTQIVRYTADWKNGYNAEVIYEGEAVYPEPKPQKKNNYENERNVDSQAGRPTPGYNYKAPAPVPRPTQPAPLKSLYDTPNKPFGVRNSPKFGYNK